MELLVEKYNIEIYRTSLDTDKVKDSIKENSNQFEVLYNIPFSQNKTINKFYYDQSSPSEKEIGFFYSVFTLNMKHQNTIKFLLTIKNGIENNKQNLQVYVKEKSRKNMEKVKENVLENINSFILNVFS